MAAHSQANNLVTTRFQEFITTSTTVVLPSALLHDQECAICIEQYIDSAQTAVRVTVPGCNHIFDLTCLTAMLNNAPFSTKKCPICRTVWIPAEGDVAGRGETYRSPFESARPILQRVSVSQVREMESWRAAQTEIEIIRARAANTRPTPWSSNTRRAPARRGQALGNGRAAGSITALGNNGSPVDNEEAHRPIIRPRGNAEQLRAGTGPLSLELVHVERNNEAVGAWRRGRWRRVSTVRENLDRAFGGWRREQGDAERQPTYRSGITVPLGDDHPVSAATVTITPPAQQMQTQVRLEGAVRSARDPSHALKILSTSHEDALYNEYRQTAAAIEDIRTRAARSRHTSALLSVRPRILGPNRPIPLVPASDDREKGSGSRPVTSGAHEGPSTGEDSRLVPSVATQRDQNNYNNERTTEQSTHEPTLRVNSLSVAETKVSSHADQSESSTTNQQHVESPDQQDTEKEKELKEEEEELKETGAGTTRRMQEWEERLCSQDAAIVEREKQANKVLVLVRRQAEENEAMRNRHKAQLERLEE